MQHQNNFINFINIIFNYNIFYDDKDNDKLIISI